MDVGYRHTQVGYVIVGAFVVAMVGLVGVWLSSPAPASALIPIAILALCTALFPSLTTEVKDGRVRCSFGPGLIRRTIPVNEIVSSNVVRNPWYYGWGLHWIPGGSLWNVSGMSAVELKLKNGRVFRIGSDEPETLNQAIRSALPAAA